MENIFQLSSVQFVIEMCRTAFEGIEWFVAAYVLCIVFFLFRGRETLKLTFVYPLAFMLVTVFNPFLIVPVAEMIGLTIRFRRLFWLLPVNLVLAYAFACICTAPAKKMPLSDQPQNALRQTRTAAVWRVAALICCTAFTVICGTSVLPYLRMPQNVYKTSTAILSISSIIEEDSAAAGLDKTALYSDQQLLELRQFDPTITSQLRRSDLLDWEPEDLGNKTIQKIIKSGNHSRILALVIRCGVQIDPDVFRESIDACGINYIISTAEMELGDYFNETGFELIGEAGIYEVYRISH